MTAGTETWFILFEKAVRELIFVFGFKFEKSYFYSPHLGASFVRKIKATWMLRPNEMIFTQAKAI